MITRKSKIRYEIITDIKEFNEIKEMFDTDYYRAVVNCELINYNPKDLTYRICYTKKQYKQFKKIQNETKNKKGKDE